MKLKFTHSAEAEFLNVLDYIRRDNPYAAKAFRQKAEQKLQRLKQFPNSGRALPEFPQLVHREVIVAPYRFFYRVSDDSTILIVAVWHCAQLPQEPQIAES